MFCCINYSDREKFILKNATNESVEALLKKTREEGYRLKQTARIKNRNMEVTAVIYTATKKPKYIWEQ